MTVTSFTVTFFKAAQCLRQCLFMCLCLCLCQCLCLCLAAPQNSPYQPQRSLNIRPVGSIPLTSETYLPSYRYGDAVPIPGVRTEVHHHGSAPVSPEVYPSPHKDEGKSHWWHLGQKALQQSLSITRIVRPARNVVLFLGDGLGIPTITASRIYKGQRRHGVAGEEEQLLFETFPNVALVKTYCVDRQVPDSASTATAFMTGVKANYETLGVDDSVKWKDCASMRPSNTLTSLAQWALQAGKRAGIVTSTRITHATPAAAYARSAYRGWECDGWTADLKETCPDFKDIARQLVEDDPGRQFNVIMGGGYQYLSADAANRTGDLVDTTECLRQDGRNLMKQWKEDRRAEGKSVRSVRTRSALMSLDTTGLQHLMGIFANNHLPWEFQKIQQNLDIPTLAEMTRKAIEVLQQEDNGFFLLVEGGRIDHAHHKSSARKALDETLAFEDALQTAMDMLDTKDTLFVVTADHSHVMTINGYPSRGNDIVGISDVGIDGLPYTTLMYTNGVGSNYIRSPIDDGVTRRDITADDVTDFEYHQQSLVPMEKETHGGEDVAVYATGPMAYLFHGVQEQSFLAHAMAYAACVGHNTGLCTGRGAAAAAASQHGLIGVAIAAILLLSFTFYHSSYHIW